MRKMTKPGGPHWPADERGDEVYWESHRWAYR